MSNNERMRVWEEYNAARRNFQAFCKEQYKRDGNLDMPAREAEWAKVVAAEERLIAAERD